MEYDEYRQHMGSGYFRAVALKARNLFNEYLWPITMSIVALAGAYVAFTRRNWAARVALLVAVLLPVLHLAAVPITRPPYMAPALAALFVLMIAGLRRLSAWTGAGGLIVAIALAVQASACLENAGTLNRLSHPDAAVRQARDVARLSALPGRQLVLVRYGPGSVPLYDFVHNGADIDGAKVVFARSIDPEHDRQLLAYFHEHRPWLLVFDEPHYSLTELADRP